MFACFELLEILVYIDVEQEKLKRQTWYLRHVLTTSLMNIVTFFFDACIMLQTTQIERQNDEGYNLLFFTEETKPD
jgi:hypothetical protein